MEKIRRFSLGYLAVFLPGSKETQVEVQVGELWSVDSLWAVVHGPSTISAVLNRRAELLA